MRTDAMPWRLYGAPRFAWGVRFTWGMRFT